MVWPFSSSTPPAQPVATPSSVSPSAPAQPSAATTAASSPALPSAAASAPPASASSASVSPASPPVSSSSSSSSRPSRPYADLSRAWVVPGSVGGVLLGATVGAGLSAWHHRPLWRSSKNVALKLGLRSFVYLSSVAMYSERLAPEFAEQRLLVHMGSGFITGGLMGGMANRFPGAVRGGVLGAAVGLPLWFFFEGRLKMKKADKP